MINPIDFPERNSFYYKWQEQFLQNAIPAFTDGHKIVICCQADQADLEAMLDNNGRFYIILDNKATINSMVLQTASPFDLETEVTAHKSKL